VLNEDGEVVATETNNDIAACIEVLGVPIADVDSSLALDLGLLDINDPLNDSQVATLNATLDDTQIGLLNDAFTAGDVNETELQVIVRGLEEGELTADELEAALNSDNVEAAIDELVSNLIDVLGIEDPTNLPSQSSAGSVHLPSSSDTAVGAVVFLGMLGSIFLHKRR